MKVRSTGASALAFDDFHSDAQYTDEQTAAMRACYDQRVAGLK